MTAVLRAVGLDAGYDSHPVVRGLNLHVEPGEVVALLGANGAGKTTTLLTLAGVVPQIAGQVELFGEVTKSPLHKRASLGVSLVLEDRSLFMDLSVAENLRVGRCDIAKAVELFPELDPLMGRRAGLLSGGEQQMLTLSRALAREPAILMADELSLGLAPLIVQRLLASIRKAADEQGTAILLIEQHVKQVLRYADRVYVLRRGEVVYEGRASDAAGQLEELETAYLVDEPTPAQSQAPGLAGSEQ
jgi:ABC-type branched-subunit amino acid transport system ATPase component